MLHGWGYYGWPSDKYQDLARGSPAVAELESLICHFGLAELSHLASTLGHVYGWQSALVALVAYVAATQLQFLFCNFHGGIPAGAWGSAQYTLWTSNEAEHPPLLNGYRKCFNTCTEYVYDFVIQGGLGSS